MTAGWEMIESPFRYNGRTSRNRIIVVHSTECPATPGIGRSLAAGFFHNTAGTSAHGIVDPATETEMVYPRDTAWHVGNGNAISTGLEHAGYAGWSAEQWRDPAVMQELRRSARYAAEVAAAYDIPVRWLSIGQIADGESGFASHNDMSIALGGSDHWDPGPNFPYAEYLDMVRGGTTGGSPTPPPADFLEELLMALQYAVVFRRDNKAADTGGQVATVWACYLLTGGRRKIDSMATLEDVISEMQKAGIAVEVPAGAYGQRSIPGVNNIWAFGEPI